MTGGTRLGIACFLHCLRVLLLFSTVVLRNRKKYLEIRSSSDSM